MTILDDVSRYLMLSTLKSSHPQNMFKMFFQLIDSHLGSRRDWQKTRLIVSPAISILIIDLLFLLFSHFFTLNCYVFLLHLCRRVAESKRLKVNSTLLSLFLPYPV